MADIATLALSAAKGESRTYIGTHQTSGSNTTPLDITGWTIRITARQTTHGSIVLNKTASVTSGPNGTYTFSVTPADTNISPAPYPVDIWRVDSGSETLMGLGTWTVLDEVLN